MEPTDWQIFISYAHADGPVVTKLTELIRVTGVPAFRDSDSIPKGKQWRMVIANSIATCKTIIVFWSASAATSKAVAEEYRSAINLKKDVVPVLLDATALNDTLREYQWIDLRDIVKLPDSAKPVRSIVRDLIDHTIGSVVSLFGVSFAVSVSVPGPPLPSLTRSNEIQLDRLQQEAFLSALEARISNNKHKSTGAS